MALCAVASSHARRHQPYVKRQRPPAWLSASPSIAPNGLNITNGDDDDDDHSFELRAQYDPVLLTDKVFEVLLADEVYGVPKNKVRAAIDENVGDQVTARMWTVVVEWMGQVCDAEEQSPSVFPFAVNYLNRFLGKQVIQKRDFQLLAITCLWLASKLRETRAFTADELLIYTERTYSKDELLKWEFIVLRAIEWTLTVITPLDFVPHLFFRALPVHLPVHVQKLAYANTQKIIHDCLSDVKMQLIRPSIIACASLIAAVAGLSLWFSSDPQGAGAQLLARLEEITDNDKDAIYHLASIINPNVTFRIDSASPIEEFDSLFAETTPTTTTT